MFGNAKLKRRIKSLEEALGVEWYDHSERHAIYWALNSEDDGFLHDLRAEILRRLTTAGNQKTLYRLMDYLGVTEVTHPEKTVIERIKKGRK